MDLLRTGCWEESSGLVAISLSPFLSKTKVQIRLRRKGANAGLPRGQRQRTKLRVGPTPIHQTLGRPAQFQFKSAERTDPLSALVAAHRGQRVAARTAQATINQGVMIYHIRMIYHIGMIYDIRINASILGVTV